MRHPLHSICPYFAMFPEAFVAEQLLAYTRPDDLVFDPFCGRGTTVLESLLNGRLVIGTDINPVAACISGAKAQVPAFQQVFERVNKLEEAFKQSDRLLPPTEFFAECYHPRTFAEIAFLRKHLKWRSHRVDRFIAANCLGILHGESHRSSMYLSNRMPRTISTKPEYSVRWWRERNMRAPERKTFELLRETALFRLSHRPPKRDGHVVLADARRSNQVFKGHRGKVALVVTSPPYLDTTDYAEDQWLRLWFLGGPDHPQLRLHKDDRHTVVSKYWSFLQEIWQSTEPLLRDRSTIVVRIGGTRLTKKELLSGLKNGLTKSMGSRRIRALHSGKSSLIANRQTNSFRPGTSGQREEHDFAFRVT